MSDRIDCIVIGAGAVGLAIARAVARGGRETLVLEAADAIGTVTSSRNSEVIHAGIYYSPASLKARLCVAGRNLLYEFCASHGVEAKRCGKLIVATSDAQRTRLAAIEAAGRANGVADLTQLTQAQALALEPDLRCTAALWSPSTGIIDSHAYMLALQADLEAAGGTVALDSPVLGGACTRSGIRVSAGARRDYEIEAPLVINCAGLGAQGVAHRLQGLDPATIPPLHYAKGNYYRMERPAPFRHLIYPMPEDGWLGVHLTLDLAGRARFGPDVEWVKTLDYEVDPSRSARFYAAIRDYWPALPDGALQADYAGIRPKLVGEGSATPDFMIQGPKAHGIAGLVNLYGIESPGLTASLAIGDYVAALARD
jgi:L-2-hydroxyglutarate oxidase LhgO